MYIHCSSLVIIYLNKTEASLVNDIFLKFKVYTPKAMVGHIVK